MGKRAKADVKYASWIRVVSYLIDFAALILIFMVLGGVLALLGLDPAAWNFSLYNLGSLILVWLYFSIQESSSKQATFGMQAVGIVVTDLAGKRISFKRATVRYFSQILSAMLFWTGYIMIVVSKTGQALHDRIAGTLVVYKQIG